MKLRARVLVTAVMALAAADAGLSRIDNLLTTHLDEDSMPAADGGQLLSDRAAPLGDRLSWALSPKPRGNSGRP